MLVGAEYGMSRDQLYNLLKKHNIFARRYFYPLITELSVYREMAGLRRHPLSNAEEVAKKVICLPIYPGLELADLEKIVSIVRAGSD
jgi:dTDP-4-amino-4,6-dideoxygalactose transaminase